MGQFKRLDEQTLRELIRKHNVPVKNEEIRGGETRIILKHCVFDESHTGKDAAIIIRPGGEIGYKCFHDSCKGRTIGDFVKKYEPDFYKDSAFNRKPETTRKQPILKRLKDIQEKDAEWLIPGYIPKGSITLLAGDGGTGKTFIWCNLVAAVTTGEKSILEQDIPFPSDGQGKDVLFFSSEDSAAVILRRRLRKAGADADRVQFVDMSDPDFDSIKFNSPELANIIDACKPALCVFDPIQSFIPADVNMSSRNAMRQCLSPLASMGEKYGTSFLIVLHTNKKQNVSGRTRIADSADIWDASRSVLMTGYTENRETMYLSHEKSNYGEQQKTVLYSIEDESVQYKGLSDLRDADYVRGTAAAQRPAPAREDAKNLITEFLKDNEWHKTSELDDFLKGNGIAFATLKRAKKEMKDAGTIEYMCTGFGSEKVFHARLVRQGDTK